MRLPDTSVPRGRDPGQPRAPLLPV